MSLPPPEKPQKNLKNPPQKPFRKTFQKLSSMKKLWLIIQREYITRVRKKSFILITLLSPIIMVAIMTLPALLVSFAGEDQQQSIAVVDESGVMGDKIDNNGKLIFDVREEPLEDLRKRYKELGFDGVLHIPKLEGDASTVKVTYYTEDQLSLSLENSIERVVADRFEDYKMKLAGYDQEVINSFKTKVALQLKEQYVDETGQLVEKEKKSSAGVATIIGFVAGFVIYMILIFYGAMIMRSVMEEKTNRIVEVIISSVRPFQLMLGKIIGVSGVGLTQMLTWIILVTVLMSVVGMFISVDPASMQDAMNNPMVQSQPPQMGQLEEMLDIVTSQNWGYIIPVFLIYFLGGYFIYSSMFAAVGSAMGDDLGEGQPLTFVVMLPIILSIIMISPVIENPNSSLAVWLSMIPLTSPVIMPARVAFEPPLWQFLVSAVILLASAVLFVWLSGRIYRVGILLYGKKASLKELGKWMFYKD